MQSEGRLIMFVTAFAMVGFLTAASPMFAANGEKVLHSFNGKDGYGSDASLIFDAAGNLYGTTAEGGADATGCNGYGCGTVFKLTRGTNGVWAEKVLHSFDKTEDGHNPQAALTLDAAGNLYGTTVEGGADATGCNGYGCGTVFMLTPGTNGAWTEKVLHSFADNNGTDGCYAFASLIFDAAGNLYGTTMACGAYGGGTVFQLSPGAGGTWTETILYTFCSASACADGEGPFAGLIFDAAGNLYGTTSSGGAYSYGGEGGTVFKLTALANGTWTEAVLHSFADDGKDGHNPTASVAFDTSGNLYGTTQMGGPNCAIQSAGCGTVFQLAPGVGGTWTETLLHSFADSGRDGRNPFASLIFDAAGNLYGTTDSGGADAAGCSGYGCGIVFQLTPGAGGAWTENVLHRFTGYTRKDGSLPIGGLIFDSAGNLYGTTQLGGAYRSKCKEGKISPGCGAVFEITP
jgi:uncharacterized repeat protein (TIGR03803 family)